MPSCADYAEPYLYFTQPADLGALGRRDLSRSLHWESLQCSALSTSDLFAGG